MIEAPPAPPPAKPAADSPATTSPNVVLAMLLLVSCFNFLDRQILSILAQPVKADLGLSDTQMGALGGIAFALFFSTMAVPMGLIADRRGRARVIGLSLAVWSLFTALCGFAANFWQLFLFRLGVGVGEAGGVAPSYAIIAERFPPERRARALAIYSLGIPIGSAAGALFGSMIAARFDWRVTFVVLGLAGLLAYFPFRKVVRDPPENNARSSEPGDARAVFLRLARQPAFWLLSVGAAASAFCSYGFAFWIPALLQRSFGLTLIEAGQFVGAQLLLAGTTGMYLGGVLADRAGKAGKAGYARIPAITYLISGLTYATAFVSRDIALLFLLLLAPSGISFVWLGPVATAIQHLVPARDRATASACYLLVVNGIGLGFGSLVIGRISDLLDPTYGEDALRYAMICAAPVYLIAAILMLLAAPRLKSAWLD